jgi:hypothetical protein
MKKKPEDTLWRSTASARKATTDERSAKLRELRLAHEATQREAGAWGDLAVREVVHEPTGAVFVHYWKGSASPKLQKPTRAPGLTAPEHAAYCAWVGQHDPEEFRQSAIAWNLSKPEALRIKQERLAAHAAANLPIINPSEPD